MKTEDKNTQIIKSAQTVFAEHGFSKVTIDDVARQLGMTRTALYYYYKNKEDLFTAVLYYEIEQYAEELTGFISNSGPALDNLLKFCTRYGGLKNRFHNMYKLSVQTIQTIESRKIFCDIRHRIRELHCRIIEKILENDKEIPKQAKTEDAARILSLSIRGIALDSKENDPDKIISDIQKLCRTYYYGLINTPHNKIKTGK